MIGCCIYRYLKVINQIKPKPWLCYRIRRRFFTKIYEFSYSGSSNTLKQVWAVGRFFVFVCLWIKNFNDFSPSIGTLSVPVTKVKKFFFST